MLVRSSIIAGFVCAFAFSVAAQNWPAAQAPAIPEADAYVDIPKAAIAPDPKFTYKAVFDSTRFPAKPESILPGINGLGGELNDLAVGKVPLAQQKFVLVFHGAAVDGILDDEHYRAKYGIANPNLPVLAKMKKMGVELFVCGQHLAAEKIDPKILTPLVTVASDAYLVLIAYQDRGYAAMWL